MGFLRKKQPPFGAFSFVYMPKAILGKKIDQSQRFDEKNNRFPITVIHADSCIVTQIRNQEKDGYESVQLGFDTKKEKNIKKPQKGHLKKAGIKEKTPRFFKEVELEKGEKLKSGDTVKVADVLKVGDAVTVTSVSKGKGFAGVVKRWGFAGGPATHGQSDRERAPGSIGGTTTPGRVYKGKKMAGRMGQDTVTIKGLKVIELDEKKNHLIVSGLVPGAKGSLLIIAKV